MKTVFKLRRGILMFFDQFLKTGSTKGFSLIDLKLLPRFGLTDRFAVV